MTYIYYMLFLTSDFVSQARLYAMEHEIVSGNG
jgi:hypothetical protein